MGHGAGESDYDYAEAAFDGLRTAGVRAVFGYLLTPQDTAAVGRAHALFTVDSPLLTMVAASLGPSNQHVESILADWHLADELGLSLVTHIGSGPVNERPIELLREHDLLRPDILYVHGNDLSDDELKMIGDSGAAVSVTPAVEARLGHGGPLIGRLRTAGATTRARRGRGHRGRRRHVLGDARRPAEHVPRPVPARDPGDILRMATLDGAVALGSPTRSARSRSASRPTS